MSKKILVVDDEKGVVDLLYKFLSKEGFEVMIATDGKTALERARKFLPDLIILDVRMPDMDGGEVMAVIEEDERLRRIPVVFLTGAVSEGEALAINQKRAGQAYISKASDIREQVKTIKKILGV
ncbi:MAG: response regulator [Candidatus Omnitrophica bacterium]|nr:response regulator [Candidatus Omnitrophota bacterium]